jgi:hypothetical protein
MTRLPARAQASSLGRVLLCRRAYEVKPGRSEMVTVGARYGFPLTMSLNRKCRKLRVGPACFIGCCNSDEPSSVTGERVRLRLQPKVNIQHSRYGGSVCIPVKGVSFRCLVKAVTTLAGAKVIDVAEFIHGEDVVAFDYKGFRFEIHAELTNYQMERPTDCPTPTFNEVVQHLANYSVPAPWWAMIGRAALP